MDEQLRWFALGAPYRNEVKVYEALCKYGIQSWVPQVHVLQNVKGRRTMVTMMAVGNLLFAYSTEKRLLEVKPFIPRMQFKVNREEGTGVKVVIPDDQMANFMRFIDGLSEVPEFMESENISYKPGVNVKVISGPLAGVTGTLVKVKGHRSRVLRIRLSCIGSCLVEVDPEAVVPV